MSITEGPSVRAKGGAKGGTRAGRSLRDGGPPGRGRRHFWRGGYAPSNTP